MPTTAEIVQMQLQEINTAEAFLSFISGLSKAEWESSHVAMQERWIIIHEKERTQSAALVNTQSFNLTTILKKLADLNEKTTSFNQVDCLGLKWILQAVVDWKKSPRWLTDKRQIAHIMKAVFKLLVSMATSPDRQYEDEGLENEFAWNRQYILPFNLYDLIGGYEDRFANFLCYGNAAPGDFEEWESGSVTAAFNLFEWRTRVEGSSSTTDFIPIRFQKTDYVLLNGLMHLCDKNADDVASEISDRSATSKLLVYLVSAQDENDSQYRAFQLFKILKENYVDCTQKLIEAALEIKNPRFLAHWGTRWCFEWFLDITPQADHRDVTKMQRYFNDTVLIRGLRKTLTGTDINNNYSLLIRYILKDYVSREHLSEDLLKNKEIVHALENQELKKALALQKQQHLIIRDGLKIFDFEAYANILEGSNPDNIYIPIDSKDGGRLCAPGWYELRHFTLKEDTGTQYMPWVLDEHLLKLCNIQDISASSMLKKILEKENKFQDEIATWHSAVQSTTACGGRCVGVSELRSALQKRQSFFQTQWETSDIIVTALDLGEAYVNKTTFEESKLQEYREKLFRVAYPKEPYRVTEPRTTVGDDELHLALKALKAQRSMLTAVEDCVKECIESIVKIIPLLQKLLQWKGANPTHRSVTSLALAFFKTVSTDHANEGVTLQITT